MYDHFQALKWKLILLYYLSLIDQDKCGCEVIITIGFFPGYRYFTFFAILTSYKTMVRLTPLGHLHLTLGIDGLLSS